MWEVLVFPHILPYDSHIISQPQKPYTRKPYTVTPNRSRPKRAHEPRASRRAQGPRASTLKTLYCFTIQKGTWTPSQHKGHRDPEPVHVMNDTVIQTHAGHINPQPASLCFIRNFPQLHIRFTVSCMLFVVQEKL